MRDILFRGRRRDNGAWIYGDLRHWHNGEIAIVGLTNTTNSIAGYEVDHATVGQFTGITDKNGKNIFDGDVVEVRTQDTGELRRAEIRFGEFADINSDEECYIGFYIAFDGVTTTAYQLKEYTNFVEIIGNIHDNPELLEGSK